MNQKEIDIPLNKILGVQFIKNCIKKVKKTLVSCYSCAPLPGSPKMPKIKPSKKEWETKVELISESYISENQTMCVKHILIYKKIRREFCYVVNTDQEFFDNVDRYKIEMYKAGGGS